MLSKDYSRIPDVIIPPLISVFILSLGLLGVLYPTKVAYVQDFDLRSVNNLHADHDISSKLHLSSG